MCHYLVFISDNASNIGLDTSVDASLSCNALLLIIIYKCIYIVYL
jgi:hypothetical protein